MTYSQPSFCFYFIYLFFLSVGSVTDVFSIRLKVGSCLSPFTGAGGVLSDPLSEGELQAARHHVTVPLQVPGALCISSQHPLSRYAPTPPSCSSLHSQLHDKRSIRICTKVTFGSGTSHKVASLLKCWRSQDPKKLIPTYPPSPSAKPLLPVRECWLWFLAPVERPRPSDSVPALQVKSDHPSSDLLHGCLCSHSSSWGQSQNNYHIRPTTATQCAYHSAEDQNQCFILVFQRERKSRTNPSAKVFPSSQVSLGPWLEVCSLTLHGSFKEMSLWAELQHDFKHYIKWSSKWPFGNTHSLEAQ